MTDYYQDFDENDDLQDDNDDDIGALGSILSWDDDDQADDAVNGAVASMSAALRERENSSGTSAPPDSVQFSMKDGVPQFSFLNQGLVSGMGTPQPQDASRDNNNNINLTLQLPLPTPIANFGPGSDLASAVGTTGASDSSAQQQQQQQQQPPQLIAKNNQGLAANFAQLLAQQAGSLMQQQKQRQGNQTNQGFTVPNMQLQQQGQQQTIQQPLQLSITADPNAFLQQLQFAQLQQQFQAAQAQQQQQQGSSSSAALGQVANAVQRVPPSQRQSNVGVTADATALGTRGRPPMPPGQRAMQPPTKRPRTTSKKPPPSSKAKSGMAPIVSASDTDGEATRKPVKTKSSDDSAADSEDKLSAEDRAKANRDRNREHARNTRLRKKAYLEKLKATVDELCRERDSLVSERTGAANLLVEMHNTRIEVLMSFLALRSTNEKRRKLWSSILDESCFVCAMPVTPYRSFPASEVQVSKCQRTILGIDAMMADTASLHVLFDSLVDRPKYPTGKIEFRYTLVTEEAVVAGNQMMARWVMSTTNATQFGAKMDVTKQGMLCCKFNSAHKITGMELMFDVMAFMLQLKQAAGSDGFSVIPNTVQTCQRSFDKPMVMTLADPPYTIVQVNKLWEDMTGYSSEEVVGKVSCSLLQREETKAKGLRELMNEIRFKRCSSATLINFKKSGERFRHFFMVFPLSTDSRITHYLALTTHVDSGDVPTTKLPPVPTASAQVSYRQRPAVLPAVAQPQLSTVPGAALPSNRSIMPPVIFNTGFSPAASVATGVRGQITLPPHMLAATESVKMPPPSAQIRSSARKQLSEASQST